MTDLRLVPAALSAWALTAAGIAWEIGWVLAASCLAVGAGWWPAARRLPVLRAATVGVVGVAALGAGLGAAVGLRTDAVHRNPVTARFGERIAVTVIASDSPHAVAGGRVMFHADLLRLGGDAAGGRVLVFGSGADLGTLSAGQPVRFRARVTRPARRDLSVAVLSATGRPVFGEASALQRAAASVRTRFAAAAREALPAEQAAILPGLVLGDTTAVTATTTARFRTAGLTHLTAVSGANVTIVCGAVLLSAVLIGPRAAVALAAVALAGFVVLVQPGASVLRAALMGAIALVAVLSSRRRQAIPALSAAVIALMVLAPQLAVDAGFALSVSATAALAVLAPAWSRRLVARGWPRPLADAVCVAVAAQTVTAPLIAAVSGRFSLVAVIANLLVAAVIPPITVLGTAAAALSPFLPGAAELIIRFTGPELWWLLQVAERAAALPAAAVPVPSGWAGLWIGLLIVGAVTVLAWCLWRAGALSAPRRAAGAPPRRPVVTPSTDERYARRSAPGARR